MFDPERFHVTDTIDSVYVLDGPVELMLDVDSVVLQAGDCVVQRRTKHALAQPQRAPDSTAGCPGSRARLRRILIQGNLRGSAVIGLTAARRLGKRPTARSKPSIASRDGR